jgi:hypothetical protein
MKLNSISILSLFFIASQTIAMQDESQHIINTLVSSAVRGMPIENLPIIDEDLLAQNPAWKITHNWSQHKKDTLLRHVVDVEHETLNKVAMARLNADPRYLESEPRDLQEEAEREAYALAEKDPAVQACRCRKALAIAVGANPNIDRALSVVDACILRDDHQLVRFLLKKGATSSRLHLVKSVKVAELLLDHGIKLTNDILDNWNLTPELMSYYLQRGARPTANEHGRTPLHYLSDEQDEPSPAHLEKMRMLIRAGVDLCARETRRGQNALHIIARIGASQEEVAAQRNAELNAQLGVRDMFGLFGGARFEDGVDERTASLLAGYRSMIAVILEGCQEQQQQYQERFTLLCCLNRVHRPLYCQRDLLKARFKLRRSDNVSPLHLLRIIGSGQTPFDIWNTPILHPAHYVPALLARNKEKSEQP